MFDGTNAFLAKIECMIRMFMDYGTTPTTEGSCKGGIGALCITQVRMMLFYPPSRPLLYYGDTPMLRSTLVIAIGETPTLGVRRARKQVGGGDGQQAREERHAEEGGGERARAATSKTEYGCTCEDHVL